MLKIQSKKYFHYAHKKGGLRFNIPAETEARAQLWIKELGFHHTEFEFLGISENEKEYDFYSQKN